MSEIAAALLTGDIDRVTGNTVEVRNAKSPKSLTRVEGLGFNTVVVVLPFDTPSYLAVEDAPCVEAQMAPGGGWCAILK